MTATPAPAPVAQSRFSLEALQRSRGARAWTGVLLAVMVGTAVWAIVSAFTGSFTDVVHIRAELPAGSNAVPIAAPVEYRNVTVGKVGRETQGPGGSVAVDFEIYPRNLVNIPKRVQAQVAPLSIFGNQYVNLVPPSGITTDAAGHLEPGDFISPYGGAPSSSLQGTVTQLYDLLHAVHPAQLDTALTAFAEALNGEGSALGHTLSGTSDYLGQAIVPNLGNVQSDLDLLPPVSQEIDRAAPDLLGTLGNSVTTGQTITSQEAALHGLLTNGTRAVGQLSGVLQQVQVSMPELLDESGPLLADVTRNPQALSETLSGLTQFASAVASQEQAGPFVSVHVALPVADISAGVNAALGYDNPASIDAALGPAANPPTYTSANCPEYPGETNPYCGTGGSPAARPAGGSVGTVQPLAVSAASTSPGYATAASSAPSASPSSPAGMMATAAADPTGAQMQAVEAIARALSGGQAPASPALATIVLLPLLSSLTGH